MSSRRSCDGTTSKWCRDGCPRTTSRRGTLASAKGRQCLPLGEGSYLEAFLRDGEFVLTSRRGTHSGADTAPQLKARGGPYPHPKTRADTLDVCRKLPCRFLLRSPSRHPLLAFAEKIGPSGDTGVDEESHGSAAAFSHPSQPPRSRTTRFGPSPTMGNIPVTATTKTFPKALRYKWESYCNTNGRRTAIQMGGALTVFPFPQSVGAPKPLQYKLEAYCNTNGRRIAILF